MITALVPIKRNSQRIPNKNFLEINSKPLFFWIIDSLLNSEFVDEIVINYDDDYTLQEVSKYFDSIKFCKRPDKLLGDDISMNKIIESSLKDCTNETIIQVHTTSPLLKTKTIDKAIKFHLDKNLLELRIGVVNYIKKSDVGNMSEEEYTIYLFKQLDSLENIFRNQKYAIPGVEYITRADLAIFMVIQGLMAPTMIESKIISESYPKIAKWFHSIDSETKTKA